MEIMSPCMISSPTSFSHIQAAVLTCPHSPIPHRRHFICAHVFMPQNWDLMCPDDSKLCKVPLATPQQEHGFINTMLHSQIQPSPTSSHAPKPLA